MPSDAGKQKRQKRGDETRRRLIAATKSLLAETDYYSITLDQVAAAVGVAKSSILWHFGSKDALLTEAVFDLFEEVDEEITLNKANLSGLEARIDHLLETVARYFTANPEAKGISLTLIFNQAAPPAIHARIREQWEQHVREIRYFLSADGVLVSETCASAIMALMHGCYLQWYVRGRSEDLCQRLPAALRALGPEIRQLIGRDGGNARE